MTAARPVPARTAGAGAPDDEPAVAGAPGHAPPSGPRTARVVALVVVTTVVLGAAAWPQRSATAQRTAVATSPTAGTDADAGWARRGARVPTAPAGVHADLPHIATMSDSLSLIVRSV